MQREVIQPPNAPRTPHAGVSGAVPPHALAPPAPPDTPGDTRAPEPSSPDRAAQAVYVELRNLAAGFLRRERAGHTLQPTALVHEAYLRMADKTIVAGQDRSHFIAVAAETMRRVLVDHARTRGALKRGGGRSRTGPDPDAIAIDAEVDMLALDDAITRLGRLDERHARVVVLKFFGGLSVEQIGGLLGVATRTVEADWALARAWLRRELSAGHPERPT